ncbi:MAG: efflux RND transporter periplasmic adaptor subunit [Kordiimonadaceae bacterium]|nr:efflux RND transporter periplasmic adaptor subunit [Kordiimonadaceae bacterium]
MKLSSVILGAVFVSLAGTAGFLLLAEPDSGQRRGGPRVAYIVSKQAEERLFTDVIEALGTAKARESVVLVSPVSDTVSSVRFTDGQTVKKGDLLVVLENQEETAQFREAEANLDQATKQFARVENLVAKGNASNASLDAERRKVEEARFRQAAAKARLDDRLITAPFDGVLGLRQVSEGTFLSSNTTITTIDDIDVVNLDFYVPERFIATLGVGQLVEAKVEAYPNRVFKGRVQTVVSRVDPVTRTILIRATIENRDHTLRPGLLMTVEVINSSRHAVSVPEEAIVPTGGKSFVYVVVGDVAERREVKLGIRRPGFVEVQSGVATGERVIVQGTMRLGRRGAKVKETEAFTPKRALPAKADAAGKPAVGRE